MKKEYQKPEIEITEVILGMTIMSTKAGITTENPGEDGNSEGANEDEGLG